MKKNIAKNLVLSILLAIIIFYSQHILYIPNIELNKYHLQLYVDIICDISLIIYICFIMIKTKNIELTKSKIFFIILLDIFLLISNVFINTENLSYLYKNIWLILYNLIRFIAIYIVLKRSLIYFENFIKNHEFKLKENKIINLFLKHPFLFSFIAILICWSIYVIAFYPIILSPDPSFQIKQFFNVRTKYDDYAILLDNNVFLTNHHPVFHTMILGYSLKLGRFLLNDNFGLFIYTLTQLLVLAFTLSLTIKYLNENNVNKKIVFIVLLLYCFIPMFPLYAMSGVKDTYYTCFIILYVMKLDKIIRSKQEKLSYKEMIQLLLIMFAVCLFRNNGIYVLILSFPLILIYSKKYFQTLLVIFIGVLAFYGTYTKVLLPSLKITDGSIRETLSIPFQQTARYVKYYNKDLSKNDIKVIDKVLGYETLAKRYNPTISDPVKNEFNKYTTKKELLAYLKVWFKCFFKHPLVYIEATLNNIYGYFSPQSTNWYIYYKYDTRITEDKLVNYHYNNLSSLRLILSSFAQGFPYIPLIGLISNIGFNTWLLLGLTTYSIFKKKKEYLIVLSPLLISLLICVASPVNTYFRYAMPFIFIMPFIFTLIVTRLKNNE